MTLRDVLDAYPLWRDLAITVLAGIVVGALWLYVSLVDPQP